MAPVATPWFFYALAGAALISALFVITRRNAVHSALALIVTLLSVAGLYLMLYAPFVGWRADHRLRGRNHVLFPVRDHAGERRAVVEGAAVQSHLAGRIWRRRAR